MLLLRTSRLLYRLKAINSLIPAVLYRARYSATRDACDNMAHSTIFVCDVLHGDRVRRMISSGVRKKLR